MLLSVRHSTDAPEYIERVSSTVPHTIVAFIRITMLCYNVGICSLVADGYFLPFIEPTHASERRIKTVFEERRDQQQNLEADRWRL